jgi:hypothetical protein
VALAVGAVVVFVVVASVTVANIAGTSQQSCTVAAPAPSLSAQLRSLGGFDQAFDAADAITLERVAGQAASATAPDLIGGVAGRPVAVMAAAADQTDAIVVPLSSTARPTAGSRIAGLVSFLRDCAARAYFSAVDDLTTLGPASPAQFPGVSASAAAARLGTPSPQLVYTTNPFTPSWRNPSTGATIAAT